MHSKPVGEFPAGLEKIDPAAHDGEVHFCPKAETDMTGVLGKFQVEHDMRGARVISRSHELTGECETDREIDTAIQMLKDDLDACAREMKRRVALNRRGSLFEGWPSATDENVNS